MWKNYLQITCFEIIDWEVYSWKSTYSVAHEHVFKAHLGYSLAVSGFALKQIQGAKIKSNDIYMLSFNLLYLLPPF